MRNRKVTSPDEYRLYVAVVLLRAQEELDFPLHDP